MKKNIIFSTIIIILGLFIALGPQFLFKVCGLKMSISNNIDDCCLEPEVNSCCTPMKNSFPICYWTARAEIGIGLLIVALGACIIVFNDRKTKLGLYIGTFLSSLIALFLPYTLIGGCSSIDMLCHKLAFPALTIESIILLIFSVIMVMINFLQKQAIEK